MVLILGDITCQLALSRYWDGPRSLWLASPAGGWARGRGSGGAERSSPRAVIIPVMQWVQKEVVLSARPRGIHLVTDEILQQAPEIGGFRVGLAHLFIQHTSASLALNERADPEVRIDMEAFFDRLVPEQTPYFTHTYEGLDDMPAHIKAVLLGSSLTVPITGGRLNLGTWQGIYLCEHRQRGGARQLILTLMGAA